MQAGTRSWKAFSFGSFGSSCFITVDKTTASLWVDELSARVFGFNLWALLVLLMTAGGYAVQRTIERDRTRWLVFASDGPTCSSREPWSGIRRC